MAKKAQTNNIISITLSEELINDIYFDLMKEHGVISPKSSIGAYIEKRLRPIVPFRNSEIQ
jgi:hypothetical protein